MPVNFVRVLRLKGMKFGLAVDDQGRTWRGFFAKTTSEEIYHSANLGDVGVCVKCRGRVFEGWNCEATGNDLCIACVRIPDCEKVFLIKKDKTQEQWEGMQSRFIRDPEYDPVREDAYTGE